MLVKYKKVVLKLSGESFFGEKNIDCNKLDNLCRRIIEMKNLGVEVVIVVGGGNIWRYRDKKDSGIDRVISDNIGMLATIMNAMSMQSVFEKLGVSCRVCSAIDAPQVIEFYLRRRALRHLEKGRIVICAGGTGNPYFTTDTAAALRGLELNCDVLLKATKVDFVYDSDPEKHPDAKKFERLTFSEVLSKNLEFMDTTAVSLCKEGNLPIIVFNLEDEDGLKKAVTGKKIGTIISK